MSQSPAPVGPEGKSVLMVPLQTVTIEPGGTGTAGRAGEGGLVRWTRDGSAITIVADPPGGFMGAGQDGITGQLSADGRSMVFPSGLPDASVRSLWIREEDLPTGVLPEAESLGAGTDEARAREKAKQTTCLANIKQICVGLLMYAQDHDEALPPQGADLRETVMPYVRNERVLQCPEVGEGTSYALNERALGMRLGEIRSPAETVIVFETVDGKTPAYRHTGGTNIGFADGHAKWIAEANAGSLRLEVR